MTGPMNYRLGVEWTRYYCDHFPEGRMGDGNYTCALCPPVVLMTVTAVDRNAKSITVSPAEGQPGRCRICQAQHYRKDEFCPKHAPERMCRAYKCDQSITWQNKSGLCPKHRKELKGREE